MCSKLSWQNNRSSQAFTSKLSKQVYSKHYHKSRQLQGEGSFPGPWSDSSRETTTLTSLPNIHTHLLSRHPRTSTHCKEAENMYYLSQLEICTRLTQCTWTDYVSRGSILSANWGKGNAAWGGLYKRHKSNYITKHVSSRRVTGIDLKHWGDKYERAHLQLARVVFAALFLAGLHVLRVVTY